MTRVVKKILYKDLRNIASDECGEPLVSVDCFDSSIRSGYENFKKPTGLGKAILVRLTVAKKLAAANGKLQSLHPDLTLKVTYGYRPLETQRRYFDLASQKVTGSGKVFSNEDDFFEEVHKYIAVPDVAGHPAGAAIDITIFDRKKMEALDMGTSIDDLNNEKISWLENGLNKKQTGNRQLLLKIMTTEKFAPFWGEWWHYSYGDKEWAAYYGKKACYQSIGIEKAMEEQKCYYDTVDFHRQVA